MPDARSKTLVFAAHCLLNPNVKVPGSARHAGVLGGLMKLLAGQGLGVVQMSCPEAEHLGLDRPLGTDSLEQYDTPDYRKACAEQAETIRKQIESFQSQGIRVMAILGVEGSPSCSVVSVPVMKNGNRSMVPGAGLFIQALEKVLGDAGLTVPILGIPESGEATVLAEALSQLDGILDPRPESSFDERASRLGLHPLAGQGPATNPSPSSPKRGGDFDEQAAISSMHPLAGKGVLNQPGQSAPAPKPVAAATSQNAFRSAQETAPIQPSTPPQPRHQTALEELKLASVGIQLTEGLLQVQQADGPALEMSVDSIRRVSIQTFGLGSDGPGPLWVLEASMQKIAFPMGMEGENLFLAAVQTLPGFDDGALVDAVSAVGEGQFVCWSKS
ncbi:MAG: hypothetical protein JRF33_10790 [Deltaproteobacteria bacterium]|nr:hypothetical protein [Deltaproteobacteria bacterium]